MKVGVDIFLTDRSIQPVRLAEELEERGYESLWAPEHSHIPTSRRTPWGGRPAETAPPLPEFYCRLHDAFVALAAAAAVTDRLKIGTGVTLVAQHDPIWLAKQVASLDVVSDGRLMFGIGFGWNREEMDGHGVDPAARRRLVAEKIGLMKALWTQERASYSGEMLRLEESWAWPKPVQDPHPPIILGSSGGPKALDALARYCDGWMPTGTPGELGNLAGRIAAMREYMEGAGRDPSEIEITLYAVQPGDVDRLDWESLGISRLVIDLPSAPAEAVIPVLDKYRRLIER